jgi:hypothetical protein
MATRKVRSLEERMSEAKEKVDKLETQVKIRELKAKISRRRRPVRR